MVPSANAGEHSESARRVPSPDMPALHSPPRMFLRDEPSRRRTRRNRVLATLTALVLVGAGAVAVLHFTRDDGRAAGATAELQSFLDAWAAGRPEQASRHTDDPRAATSLLTSVRRGLHPKKARFTAGGDVSEGAHGALTVPFTAEVTLDVLGRWSYRSSAELRPRGDGWTVHWRSSVVHPKLDGDSTLVLSTGRAERAPVLAADGSPLAAETTVYDIGIWPARLTDPERAYRAFADPALGADIDIAALRRRVEKADPDRSLPVVSLRESVYRKVREDLIGIPGLQYHESRKPLALSARSVVGSVDASGKGVSGLQSPLRPATLRRRERVGRDGRSGHRRRGAHPRPDEATRKAAPLRTTLSPAVQKAAERALDGMEKNAAIVAVKPSTGEILAAADNPAGGSDRSLSGRYPPGSTFKVVTASALIEGGMRADDRGALSEVRQCPWPTLREPGRVRTPARYYAPSGFRQILQHRFCRTASAGSTTTP